MELPGTDGKDEDDEGEREKKAKIIVDEEEEITQFRCLIIDEEGNECGEVFQSPVLTSWYQISHRAHTGPTGNIYI